MDGNTTQKFLVLKYKISTWITQSSKSPYRLTMLWRGFHLALFCSIIFPFSTTTLNLP